MSILIIGGGLAGLACGVLFQRSGHEVTVVEASDDVGGRVRSDYINGYTLDRGFQVLFDAYPAAKRLLNLRELDLRPFDPGAMIATNGRRSVLTDPLRDRSLPALLGAALTLRASPADKLRVLRLALQLRRQSIEDVLSGIDTSTIDYLHERGFSSLIIENFFRPFYGGIFLDRSLETSAKCFRFNLKMLSEGRASVPAGGMGRITQQLAEPLAAEGRIRLNAPVGALLRDGGRVIGARLINGKEIFADVVVLATSAPVAAQLSGLPTVEGALQNVTVYLAGAVPLYREKKIVLNASPEAFVNNAQILSNVAPSYAPEKRHLLSAVVLGTPPASDEELVARVLADLKVMFAGSRRSAQALNGYGALAVYRIPYAQFPQPPGIHPKLPDNRSVQRGLYFAGEFTEASSINAALVSAEKCVETILEDIADGVVSEPYVEQRER